MQKDGGKKMIYECSSAKRLACSNVDGHIWAVSTVEAAVRKVRSLSESQAKALLDLLAARPALLSKAPIRRSGKKGKGRPTMRQIMDWYASIRGTTDWEPPRMPDDLVRRVSL
jgi:hypothetical protein